MAHAPVMLAHGDKEPVELRGCGLGKGTHILDKLAGFGAGLVAEALVGDDLEFFGINIKYHADRRVLRGGVAVIVALAVIALRLNIGMRMNVAAEMDADPRRALYVKAVAQIANRGVPR